MSRRASVIALGVIFALQAIDLAIRFAGGTVPVLGVCVLAVAAAAIVWLILHRAP